MACNEFLATIALYRIKGKKIQDIVLVICLVIIIGPDIRVETLCQYLSMIKEYKIRGIILLIN